MGIGSDSCKQLAWVNKIAFGLNRIIFDQLNAFIITGE
jgi:hypothetical protein